MRVFISWSGERSRQVASALKIWLEDVFQDVEAWMSANDIEAGARWGAELNDKLGTCNLGILCLTAENLTSPWILFEAGSLAKAFDSARVIPYRLGISATDVGYPLAQFQGVSTDRDGTIKLLHSINNAREQPLPEARLNRQFERCWGDLETVLAAIPASPNQAEPKTQRPERELLEELLQLARETNRLSNGGQKPKKLEPMIASHALRQFMRESIYGIEGVHNWYLTEILGGEKCVFIEINQDFKTWEKQPAVSVLIHEFYKRFPGIEIAFSKYDGNVVSED